MIHASRVRCARLFCQTLLLLALATAGGCAAAALATVGTAADITASAVTTGRTVFTLGKLETAEMVNYDEAIAASRRGAADLALTAKGEVRDKQNTKITLAFNDDKKSPVWITLDRRTDHFVEVSINVGLFGSETTAQLILSRIREHLPHPATAPSHPAL